MSTANNTDFLRFSAYSIKELITRKLATDTNFTDQVYEGSNLAILIDIVSYMYQCLIYNLNNTAAESMFADTLIYENINRLVKFIGYNPKGCYPSNIVFNLDNSNPLSNYTGIIIPKYTAIDTGLTDTNGKKIYFSTIITLTITSAKDFLLLMYNGLWKLYKNIYTSSGDSYLTFILDGLKSDSIDDKYVALNMIDVYVLEPGSNTLEQYTLVNENLFTDNNILNGTNIYTLNDAVFNLRLNETKTYEISFGNGFTGKIPSKNSTIYIFYLDTNGPYVEIDPGQIESNLKHEPNLFGISETLYQKVFPSIDWTKHRILNNTTVSLKNSTKSTEYTAEESVELIRRNAPEWFKTGNRLVTADDYIYYVKNRFADNIIDVVCQNNWEYISTFYRWLYTTGLNGNFTKPLIKGSSYKERKPSATYYITQSKFSKYDYKFADAADSNNVYLWIKMKNDTDIYKSVIDSEILPIKTLTQEVVYVSPITVYFTPCAEDLDSALEYFYNDSTIFDSENRSYIEITIDNNTLYSNGDIATLVANVITKYFTNSMLTIGCDVNPTTLVNKILEINSITRVRTIFNNNKGTVRIRNGISFASWSGQMVDTGDDLDITTSVKTLEPFLFPALYNSANIAEKIVVIRKSMNSINSIQY